MSSLPAITSIEFYTTSAEQLCEIRNMVKEHVLSSEDIEEHSLRLARFIRIFRLATQHDHTAIQCDSELQSLVTVVHGHIAALSSELADKAQVVLFHRFFGNSFKAEGRN